MKLSHRIIAWVAGGAVVFVTVFFSIPAVLKEIGVRGLGESEPPESLVLECQGTMTLVKGNDKTEEVPKIFLMKIDFKRQEIASQGLNCSAGEGDCEWFKMDATQDTISASRESIGKQDKLVTRITIDRRTGFMTYRMRYEPEPATFPWFLSKSRSGKFACQGGSRPRF